MKIASLLLWGLSVAGSVIAAPASTAFFVVAHPDDWQLFMNPNAYTDLRNTNAKTVIVHTTAGDAGIGTGTNGRLEPYYLAREEGALRALRFARSAHGTVGAQELIQETPTVNGHRLTRYASPDGRAVMYFLRLPDGSPSGAGYASTGRQSVQRLKVNGVPIAAVDGSTRYATWSDLTSTLAQLVRNEATGSPTV